MIADWFEHLDAPAFRRSQVETSQATKTFMLMEDKNVTCFCNFCNNWLPFRVSRTGETVNCPNCTMETVLYLPEASRPYPLDKYAVEIRKIRWEVSQLGFRCIAGEVVNSTPSDLDWVRIEFILFNQVETAVGLTSDCLIGYQSGAVWKFRAPVFEDEVVRASLPSLSTEFGKVAQGGPVSIRSGVRSVPPALHAARF